MDEFNIKLSNSKRASMGTIIGEVEIYYNRDKHLMNNNAQHIEIL